MAGERSRNGRLWQQYAAATEPGGDAVRKALGSPQRRPGRRVWTGALVAAAFLLALARVPSTPSPEAPVPSAAPSTPLAEGETLVVEGVVARVQGSGVVAAEGQAVSIEWAVGTLDLDVAPGQGLNVAVATPEARLRVVGTGFQVRRTALGTEVMVRKGVVEVTCEGGLAVAVLAGGSQLCLPTTPAAFLGRARALEAAGAPALEVRAAAERGLAGSVSPGIRGELEVVRIRSFLAEGRDADGLAAAGAYLRAGYPDRRDEVLRVALSLAVASGECGPAREWHAELGDEGDLLGCGP